jgi:hypothetical protein
MKNRSFRIIKQALVASVCALAFATQSALTQEPEETDGPGMGFFQIGYIGLDLDDLNGSLAGAGYPSLDESFFTLGGAGYGIRGRLMIGGEGHLLLGSDETTASGATRVSAGGGYGLFRLGYSVLSRAGVDIFPALGIGGGSLNMTFAERSAPTFDDVLADPQRSARLSTGMFLLDASAVLTYRITVRESEEGEAGGLLVGLQAGYTFAPGDTSWTLDDLNDVAGGPGFQVEGFHIELSIGGWGRGS